MISFLIKYKKIILIITLAFFLGSIVYLGLDAYHRGSFSTVAAKVGKKEISLRTLDRLTQNRAQSIRDQGIDLDDDMMSYVRARVLQSLISEEIAAQAAQESGLGVSDYEVAYNIKSLGLGGDPNGAFDKNVYAANVKRVMGISPAEFEEQLRNGILASRFRTILYSLYKLTPEEIKHSYQIQQGNLKDFDANKKEFALQLMETKMETAQRAFFDDFNQRVQIKTYLQDTQD
ncbi:SurA N-terminal domain-containing protein [Candidatus Avelusimicrobium luingense]|uniref:SurA N-terminal domain-containing protein n=1 Tax=Candidatus Avelusimicrobium luingense TaxID=3416211 RepID=UPI003D0FDAD9